MEKGDACGDTDRQVNMSEVSVATTRKALALIRRSWSLSTPSAPFDPTSTLEGADMPGVSLQEFSFRFTQSHALKRHRKGANKDVCYK
jgi:hypothetical protein